MAAVGAVLMRWPWESRAREVVSGDPEVVSYSELEVGQLVSLALGVSTRPDRACGDWPGQTPSLEPSGRGRRGEPRARGDHGRGAPGASTCDTGSCHARARTHGAPASADRRRLFVQAARPSSRHVDTRALRGRRPPALTFPNGQNCHRNCIVSRVLPPSALGRLR